MCVCVGIRAKIRRLLVSEILIENLMGACVCVCLLVLPEAQFIIIINMQYGNFEGAQQCVI